jgi:predicted acyltransferase
LKSGWSPLQKLYRLLLLGGASLLLAWIISFFEPINKHLWTSSMTFLTSGISIVLMAITYYLVDGLKWHFGLMWLKIYGMNSILAYMLYNTLEVSSLTHYWLHGLKQYTGDYYPFFTELAKVLLIFAILRYCYKRSIFLRA